jgi:hypothetical protein
MGGKGALKDPGTRFAASSASQITHPVFEFATERLQQRW